MSRLENGDGFYSNQKSNKITIRIQPDREEEWENYRKANNFESMSSFIRTAVNGYIINEKERNGEKILINSKIVPNTPIQEETKKDRLKGLSINQLTQLYKKNKRELIKLNKRKNQLKEQYNAYTL